MKIAMLGVKGVPAIGGIAHYVEQLGSRLVERGHEVTVYCRPHYVEGNGSYRGMGRVLTRGLQGKHLDALTHTATAAMHAARKGYDIIHVHACGPGVAAAGLRLLRSGKTVVTIHGLDWQRAKWSRLAAGCIKAGTRLAARFADKLVVVSDAVGDEFAHYVGRRPRTIPTGMQLAELAPPQEIDRWGLSANGYVLCAARLTPEKGLHYLIEAFERIATDKKLVIAGDSPYQDDYTRALRSHASDRVLFVGYVSGPPLQELFSNAYLYVQPSDLEGLPVSVLEALSYGRCVLASDIAPNQEALGHCGFTFRSGDVASLRASLEMLLSDEDAVAAQFDIARRHIAQERSWDKTVDGYETVYGDAIAGREALAAEQPVAAG